MTSDEVITRLLALEQFGIKLGLDNIRTLTRALHNPQDSFRSVHIAGTNGKGSVSAMVERALRDGGFHTGRYTSPHLDRLEERIALDGAPVDAQQFIDTTAHVFAQIDDLRRREALDRTPTFFEVTTAIAFEVFRRAAVDVAVVEVGLGGRFDATNVINPDVTAIASIAFDHERHLGNSLASIAYEKAGILKRGVPAVIGAVQTEAFGVIEEVAVREGSPLVFADRRLLREVSLVRGQATISVRTPSAEYREVPLALPGEHQVLNALVAIRVLEELTTRGIPLAHHNIVTGLTGVIWPARLEWLRLADGSRVLIDAAHNVAGAAALAQYVAQSGTAPLPFVISIMKDKDVDGIVRAIAPVASRVVATTAASPRAIPAADLRARIARVAPHLAVASVEGPEDAVRVALLSDHNAVIAGSIFLVGPLRARLLAGGAISLQG